MFRCSKLVRQFDDLCNASNPEEPFLSPVLCRVRLWLWHELYPSDTLRGEASAIHRIGTLVAGSSDQLQKLLSAAATGDDSSRSRLIERASERLRVLTRMMLRREFSRLKRWEETDDVFQGAMLRLYQSLEEVRLGSLREFFGLAATQVRRTLIDLVRHHYGPEGDAAHHDTDFGSLPQVNRPTAQVHQPESLADWSRFHEVVERLPGEEQEAFSLVWYSGMNQKEAAEVLEISERTMIRRMNRARLLIYEAMGGAGPEESAG